MLSQLIWHSKARPIQRASYFLSVYRAFDVSGEEQAGDDAAAIHWLSIEEMAHANVTDSTLDVARSVAEIEDASSAHSVSP